MDADVFQPDAALLPLLPPDPDPFEGHVYFSAEQSSKGWAVYYDPKPVRLSGDRTSYGLRIPILTVFEGLASPDAVTMRVADILNKHWDGDRTDDC